MVLVCHVILQDPHGQRVKWLYGWELLIVSHHTNKFDRHGHYGSGNIMVLVCHVILQEHMTNGLGNFMGSSPSR